MVAFFFLSLWNLCIITTTKGQLRSVTHSPLPSKRSQLVTLRSMTLHGLRTIPTGYNSVSCYLLVHITTAPEKGQHDTSQSITLSREAQGCKFQMKCNTLASRWNAKHGALTHCLLRPAPKVCVIHLGVPCRRCCADLVDKGICCVTPSASLVLLLTGGTFVLQKHS